MPSKKIIGKQGSKVKLIIEREGEKGPFDLQPHSRQRRGWKAFWASKRNSGDDSWEYVVDPENKICYVRLQQFSYNTQRDLENVMKKLSRPASRVLSSICVSIRAACSIAPSRFPTCTSTTALSSPSSRGTFRVVLRGQKRWQLRRLSHGLSGQRLQRTPGKIVSACLQDHGRAVVIGSRSYGKGSVQTIQPFTETGSKLKIDRILSGGRPIATSIAAPSAANRHRGRRVGRHNQRRVRARFEQKELEGAGRASKRPGDNPCLRVQTERNAGELP